MYSPGKSRAQNNMESINISSTMAFLKWHCLISVKIYAALSSQSDPLPSHRKANNNYYFTCKKKNLFSGLHHTPYLPEQANVAGG